MSDLVDRPDEITYSQAMTLREKLHARIDQLDDDGLAELLEQLDALEGRRNRGFSQEFLGTVREARESNHGKDPDAILEDVTAVVEKHRRSRSR